MVGGPGEEDSVAALPGRIARRDAARLELEHGPADVDVVTEGAVAEGVGGDELLVMNEVVEDVLDHHVLGPGGRDVVVEGAARAGRGRGDEDAVGVVGAGRVELDARVERSPGRCGGE